MHKDIISLGLADWISDKEPNYPSFDECKEWVQIKLNDLNSNYILTKKDEENINMLLKYLPMNQLMNKKILSRYLDEIIKK
tara:strand:- start:105 stop:347 length:243 start_codon:yes stop_codon:yes gene_type:complete